MDEANPELPSADVALVIGANDTVRLLPLFLDPPGIRVSARFCSIIMI